jgi:hypothetical protein
MLHMLQWLYTYVAEVCSQCFICVFRRIVVSVFYLDVTYISHICRKCFIRILRMFATFSSVFMCFASVSEACFICLQTYVASVTSGCFKSRSGVAHVAMHVRSGGDASSPRARTGGAGT